MSHLKTLFQFIAIVLFVALGTFFLSSFKQNRPQERKWVLSLTDNEISALFNVIDNSNAPHSQVKEVINMLNGHLAGQNVPVDTTKKVVDSVKPKTKK